MVLSRRTNMPTPHSEIPADRTIMSLEDSPERITQATLVIFDNLRNVLNSASGMRFERGSIPGRYAKINTGVEPELATASLSRDIHAALDTILGRRPFNISPITRSKKHPHFAMSFALTDGPRKLRFELGKIETLPTDSKSRRILANLAQFHPASWDKDLVLWGLNTDDENDQRTSVIKPIFITPEQAANLHLVKMTTIRKSPALENLLRRV